MKRNVVDIKILPGGMVKVETGKIDPAIHAKVEEALKRFLDSMGGDVKKTNLPHSHADTGLHTHGGQGHQH